MIIEQGTNYAYKLQYITDPTFDKVRDLSVKFYRELPKPMQDELYEALNRGIDILDSEPQMEAYMHAFGKMHQAKLEYAFDKLPDDFLEQPEINIIDYGCGQALGTMCYADFLRQKGCEQKVKTITLIEPSEICLKRAALHASIFFPNAEIKTVNKTFDELTADDITCSEETPTLHILSNVLDVLDFDLEDFAELIDDNICGHNQFVCVGPYFNYSDKDERIDNFLSLLNGDDYYNNCFDKYEFDEDKAWTANIVCFTVGELQRPDKRNIYEIDVHNDGSHESPDVGYELNGYSVKLRRADNTYENTDTPIIYLSLSKDYNCQDHLVLSVNSAEELLACNGEQERKDYLLKCEVSYSEEAECYGIIRSRNTGVIYKINICNDGNYESPSVGYELDGYSVKLRRADNTYENTDTPIIYLSLSKDYNGQDHLVLSVNSAEELLACNGEQEQKAYLLNCEVAYSEEIECYGIIRHQTTKIIGNIDICNEGSYSPEVGYKLDGYSVVLRQSENPYENTSIPIVYIQLSEDYNGQDHLVLSANCAEELLACNGEQERKEYLLRCEVSYSEEAQCYGIIRHQTTKIICNLDICNDGNYSPEVGYKLDGYSVLLRQPEDLYEGANIPILYLQLSKDYNGQDHLVLSANCADELLACNGEQERKAYLLKCEVSYSKEAKCYGIIRHRTQKIICRINICNDDCYKSPDVGCELDGYSVLLRQTEDLYEGANIPILYLQLSKDYNGQDHLVLSANCADELLACNGEQEREAYLLKCEVIYSENAGCYGIIRPNNQ